MSEPHGQGLPRRGAQAAAAPAELSATLTGADGMPVLVLGNSLGTTGELWQPQLGPLGRRFRLLRYEHRGHGGSPAPPGPYSIAELGTDVLRLLDEFEIKTARYCGVSLGGMVGMWLAATAPDRIEALALCCTSAYLPPAQFWRDRAARVRADGMTSISRQVVARWFTPGYQAAHPGTVAGFVTTLERDVVPEGYAGCCEAIAAMDLRPVLASVTAPTLVLGGAEDPATPPWHGAVIASAIPGARLRVIRGAAHLANVSAAAEFSAALLAHLTA
jgi:3-oxoadipate enol-lactonase